MCRLESEAYDGGDTRVSRYSSQADGGVTSVSSAVETRQPPGDPGQSEEHYRLIAENSLDVIWTVDLEGRVSYVSPAVEKLRGYTPAEVVGLPFSAVISPSSFGVVRESMERIRAQAEGKEPEAPITAEVEQPRKDGSTVWTEVLVRVMRDDEGRPLGVLGVSRDVTKRHLAEAALRHSEARLRNIFDVAPMGIIFVDHCGRILDANPAHTRITGYSAEELRQLPDALSQLHPDEKAAARAHFASVADGEQERTAPSVWRLIRADGSTVWVRHVGVGVRAADGQLDYGVAIVEDITQAKLIEERLRQAQKMEAVGQLAGGVAHDFNNVLQVIIGYTREVLAELTTHDPHYQPLTQVEGAAKRAASLTRQLLAFGRQQVLRPEPLDLREVVQGVVQMTTRLLRTQIELDYRPGPDACPVLADRGQMEQVVVNLCLNARDAMPNGGRLTVATDVVELDDEYCRTHGCARRGPYAAIRVIDTGVGMDATTLTHIFEPFFTTKEVGQGTGLGLSVVFGIVIQHGGTVSAVSEPGQGSTFTVLIPSTPTFSPTTSPTLPPTRVPGGRETILLAEDEALLRDLARRVLQQAGYTVLIAANGEEAVQVAEQHRGGIDLLLLDLVMPRRGGLQAYEDICVGHGALPCVFVSGRLYDASGLSPVLGPGVALLSKPYERNELLLLVRQTLDARAQRAAGEPDTHRAATPTQQPQP